MNPLPFRDWLRANGHVQLEDGEVIPWEWWPVHDTMLAVLRERRYIALKARQLSWSWLLAHQAVHTAEHRHSTVLVISKGQLESSEFLRKCRVVHQHESEPQLTVQSNTETMAWESGGIIHALPSTQTAGRGFTAALIVIDEAAFHPYAAENYAAYKPAVDAGGQLIIISTANGAGNWFHQMYLGARDGQNGFACGFYPWGLRPGRDTAWYEQQRLEYASTPGKLEQEYPTNDDDAFLLSGRPRFNIEAIREHRTRIRPYLSTSVLVSTLRDIPSLQVWELPEPTQPYVAFSDVAEGLEGGDYSVTHVLNARTLRHVASLHGTWEPGYFAKLSNDLCRVYNNALWGVERNNHGHAVLLAAQQLQYPRLYKHSVDPTTAQQRNGNQPSERVGFPTTSTTKPDIISSLAEAIVGYALTSYDDEFWSECQTYVIGPSGDTNAVRGAHDDRVIAMAGCVWLTKQPGAQSLISQAAREKTTAKWGF